MRNFLAVFSILLILPAFAPANAAIVSFSTLGAFAPCGGMELSAARTIRTRRLDGSATTFNPTFDPGPLDGVSNFDPNVCLADPNYPLATPIISLFQVVTISPTTVRISFDVDRSVIAQMFVRNAADTNITMSAFFLSPTASTISFLIGGLKENTDYVIQSKVFALEPLPEIPAPGALVLFATAFASGIGLKIGSRRRISSAAA